MRIHLDNVASKKSKNRHGPGRLWLIMCKPRPWERGASVGSVPLLSPEKREFETFRETGAFDPYRESYTSRLRSLEDRLKPNVLRGVLRTGNQSLIEEGDTLCCACSTKAAADGECHRVWAAKILHDLGWDVILDGKPFA